MVCRLCLVDLNEENAIALFETSDMYSNNQILKLIAKYIQLELSQEDPVSTSICQDCSEHLEDFHQFWLYVDQKQSTIRYEFLEVECEVNILNEDNEESLLDLKNTSMEFVEVAQVEEFDCANQIDENNLEEENSSADIDIAALDDSSSDSEDDNTSLHTLRSETKKATKSKVSQRATRSKKVCKVMPQDDLGKEYLESESNARKLLKQQHEETIANFMKLSCDLCNWPVDNFGELRKHFQTSHQCSAYVKCCRRSFIHPSILVDHIRWHQNPDVYKCNICDRRMRSELGLQKHRELHLTKNETKSKSDKDHNCEMCNESFLTAQCLRLHNNYVHNSIPDSDMEHTCEICNKSFSTPERLQFHMNSVHKNVSHICDICGKNFKHKRAFEKHLLVQHGTGIVEQPAQCTECGVWLKNKNTLSKHRLKHDQVHVDCRICGRKCPSRKALNVHMDYMHKRKKNLQCNYCEKSFKLPQILEEHVATHTGALLYTCPHCSKEYRSKSNMYVHIKRAHAEEWLQSKAARSNDPNIKSGLK